MVLIVAAAMMMSGAIGVVERLDISVACPSQELLCNTSSKVVSVRAPAYLKLYNPPAF